MIANSYGNVDIREGIPPGWAHIKANHPDGHMRGCDALEYIEWYPAFVGFEHRTATHHRSSHGAPFSKPDCWRPRFDGVVVRDADAAIVLAHAVLGTPFVVITVTATLVGFDQSLIRAGSNLGASPARVFFKVVMPPLASNPPALNALFPLMVTLVTFA